MRELAVAALPAHTMQEIPATQVSHLPLPHKHFFTGDSFCFCSTFLTGDKNINRYLTFIHLITGELMLRVFI